MQSFYHELFSCGIMVAKVYSYSYNYLSQSFDIIIIFVQLVYNYRLETVGQQLKILLWKEKETEQIITALILLILMLVQWSPRQRNLWT